MADVAHDTLTGADLHVPGYVQSSDPGAVGAGKLWIDTTYSPATTKKRNSGDSGWDTLVVRHKYDGTTAPTTTDDSASGFGVGSTWIDITNDKLYRCVDSTASAAVWQRIVPASLFFDANNDLFGKGDSEYGLVKHLVDLGTTPDGRFASTYDPLTTFAGSPFETGNYDFTQPSVLRMYGSAVDKRQFLYKTVSITTGGSSAANAIVSSGVNVSFAGLRVDDGSDDNYTEFGMRTNGLSYGALSFYTRERSGGGAVTETQVGLASMNATIPYVVRIWSLTGTNFCYIKGLAPGWTFMAGVSYGYTITRRGLVVTANSADTPNSDFAGNFNSYEEE